MDILSQGLGIDSILPRRMYNSPVKRQTLRLWQLLSIGATLTAMQKMIKGATGKNSIDMLSGSLLDKILLFALPFAASSVLQQVFNSADVAVVGRFSGSEALAAVGMNGPIINLIINVFVGLSVGSNVVCATLIGQGRADKIRDATQTVFCLALSCGVFLAVAGPLLALPILRLIGTPENVRPLASRYLAIYFLGMPAIMAYNFCSSLLRAKGDSRRPLYSLTFSGVLNVALNLLFVAGFKLSVTGVAIATVISNFAAAALVVFFLVTEDEPYKLSVKGLHIEGRLLLRICRIGIPAGAQGMMFSLSNVCIQGAVNTFGSDAIAGAAAAVNFQYFSFFVVSAFSQAATTFTSQNYGAALHSRCKRIWALCMSCSALASFLMCQTFVIFGEHFLHIYTTEAEAISFALIQMSYVVRWHFLINSYEITAGSLRGMGYSVLPSLVTLAGSCLFRIVWLATVFRLVATYECVMLVYPASWLVTGSAMLSVWAIVRHRRLSA